MIDKKAPVNATGAKKAYVLVRILMRTKT